MTPLKILLAMIAITAVVALPTDWNPDTIVPEVRTATLLRTAISFGGLRWPCALNGGQHRSCVD